MSCPQIFAALVIFAAAAAANAQPADFACPKAGTVEQRSVSTLSYTGSSPNDPAVCTLISRTGKPEQRLFNLYLLSDINNTAAALTPIKAGIADILSGRKTTVSFPALASNGYIQAETWTFVRKEAVRVGDKIFNTIVLDREVTSDPRGRSDFHGHYTQWLVPGAGLWVKSDLTNATGATNFYPQSYRDQTITVP
jgi:hypothetical protein